MTLWLVGGVSWVSLGVGSGRGEGRVSHLRVRLLVVTQGVALGVALGWYEVGPLALSCDTGGRRLGLGEAAREGIGRMGQIGGIGLMGLGCSLSDF